MTSQTPANGTPEGDSSRPRAPATLGERMAALGERTAALEGERQHLATKTDLAEGLASLERIMHREMRALYRLMLWGFIVLAGMMVAMLSSILALGVPLARDSHAHPAGELHSHPPAGQQQLVPGPQEPPAPSADR